MEDLIDDAKFSDKIHGGFVRIKISDVCQKQDIYRLVKVIGKIIYFFIKFILKVCFNGELFFFSFSFFSFCRNTQGSRKVQHWKEDDKFCTRDIEFKQKGDYYNGYNI